MSIWTLKVDPRLRCLWGRIEDCLSEAGFTRSDVLRFALLWYAGLTGAVVLRHGEFEKLRLLRKVLRRCLEELDGVCLADGSFVPAPGGGERKSRPRV